MEGDEFDQLGEVRTRCGLRRTDIHLRLPTKKSRAWWTLTSGVAKGSALAWRDIPIGHTYIRANAKGPQRQRRKALIRARSHRRESTDTSLA
jgi:hypothetical protein